jgi:hypothetical protein
MIKVKKLKKKEKIIIEIKNFYFFNFILFEFFIFGIYLRFLNLKLQLKSLAFYNNMELIKVTLNKFVNMPLIFLLKDF